MIATGEKTTVRIPEEVAATPAGLIRVAVFAVLAFVAAYALFDARSRLASLVFGAAIVAGIACAVAVLLWQRRYGTAALRPARPFEHGKPFQGTIETELRARPSSAIRLSVYGAYSRSQEVFARERVDPALLREGATGGLQIPFFIVLPDDPIHAGAREVRLRARMASWPLGWGATFVVHVRGVPPE